MRYILDYNIVENECFVKYICNNVCIDYESDCMINDVCMSW